MYIFPGTVITDYDSNDTCCTFMRIVLNFLSLM
jgi:hypothetical protein